MSKGCAEVIGGLVGLAILGVGTWGSYTLGAVLGFYGPVGFIVGAGVISAGILGVCVAGAALYGVGLLCKSAFTKTRDYFRTVSAERAARREREQTLAAANMSTRSITHNLNQHSSASRPVPSAPPANTTNLYPPLYQPPRTVRAEQDNPYYAPPTGYRSYGY